MILYVLLEIAVGLLLTLVTIEAYCPDTASDIPGIQTYNSDLPYPRKTIRKELNRNSSIKRQIRKSKKKLPRVFALGRRKREIDVWNEDPTSRANRFLLKFLGFDSSRPTEEELGPTIEIPHEEFLALKEKHGRESEGKVLEISEDEFNALAEKHGGGAFIEKHAKENEGSVVEVTEEEFNDLAEKHGGEIERTVEVVHVPISPVDGDWQNVPVSEVDWKSVPVDDHGHDQWRSEQTDKQPRDFITMHGHRPKKHSRKSWQTIPVDKTNVESNKPDDHIHSNSLHQIKTVDWKTSSKKGRRKWQKVKVNDNSVQEVETVDWKKSSRKGRRKWQKFEVDDRTSDNSLWPTETVDWQTSQKDSRDSWPTSKVHDHSPNHSAQQIEIVDGKTSSSKKSRKKSQNVKVSKHIDEKSVMPVETADWETLPEKDPTMWQNVDGHIDDNSVWPVETDDWHTSPKDSHESWQTVKVDDNSSNHFTQPVEIVDWKSSSKKGRKKWQNVDVENNISDNSWQPVETVDWHNPPKNSHKNWQTSKVDDHSPTHSVHHVENVDLQSSPKDDKENWQSMETDDRVQDQSAKSVQPIENVDWQTSPKHDQENWQQTVETNNNFQNQSAQPIESVDWQTSSKDDQTNWQTVRTDDDWNTPSNDHQDKWQDVEEVDDHTSSSSISPLDDWENSPTFSSFCSPIMRSFSFKSNVFYKNMDCWVLPKFKKTVFTYADCRKATCSSSDAGENGLSFTCVPADIKTYDIWFYCGYLHPKFQKYKLKLPQHCDCKEKTCFR